MVPKYILNPKLEINMRVYMFNEEQERGRRGVVLPRRNKFG